MAYHNIYVGIRYRDVPFVAVNGKPLSPRQDLIEHSSKGFEWGYGGCRPAQLALALLAHELTDAQALDHHHRFKWDVVASLPHNAWILTAEDIHGWLLKTVYDRNAIDQITQQQELEFSSMTDAPI